MSQQPLHLYQGLLNGPPFSRWYLIHCWPKLDVLDVTSTLVQNGFNPRLLERGTWTIMKGEHYLPHRREAINVTSASPGGLVCLGGGSVCLWSFVGSAIDPQGGQFISPTSIVRPERSAA